MKSSIYKFDPTDRKRRLTEVFSELSVNLDTRCAEIGKCGGCSVDLLEGELVNIHTGETVSGKQRLFACLFSLSPTSSATISVPEKSVISKKTNAVSKFKISSDLTQGFTDRTGNKKGYSIAIDVGTTTVAVMLVKIENAEVLSTKTDFNMQIKYGDNVLTRIKHCQTDKAMTQKLKHAIMYETLLPLIMKALGESSVELSEIEEVVISGNTTMQHLCAGVNPQTIGVAPFTPIFTEVKRLSFMEAFGEDFESCNIDVLLLPSVSAYLGADVLAGALVSGVVESVKPTIIVDVGTNGEMILNTGCGLVGCSTAAGPAFEGAGLSSGTRAADGAVSHMYISGGSVTLDIIGGDIDAIGICGTAYFDFLANGVHGGLLSSTGRFTHKFMDEYAEYVREGDSGMEFCLLGISNEYSPKITEGDVASLLQAKAAVAAGLETMLNRYNIDASDLDKVYLAGGFGMYLNVESALACGLLPEVMLEQVELVGNTSLAGAYVAIDKAETVDYLSSIATKIEVVELNLDEDFEDFYIDNMMLPC